MAENFCQRPPDSTTTSTEIDSEPLNVDVLYDWLDTINFTRRKSNIAADFSDGVLAAEAIAYFIPKLVDLNNYYPTVTNGQKRINWTTLNRKVLKHLGLQLSEATIIQIAESKPGIVEHVLWAIRKKILNHDSTSCCATDIRSKQTLYRTNPLPSIPAIGYRIDDFKKPDKPHQRKSNSPPPTRFLMPELKPPGSLDQNYNMICCPNVIVKTESLMKIQIEDNQTPLPLPSDNTIQTYYGMAHNGTDSIQRCKVQSQPAKEVYYRGVKFVPYIWCKYLRVENKYLAYEIQVLEKRNIVLQNLNLIKAKRVENLLLAYRRVRNRYEKVTKKAFKDFPPTPKYSDPKIEEETTSQESFVNCLLVQQRLQEIAELQRQQQEIEDQQRQEEENEQEQQIEEEQKEQQQNPQNEQQSSE